MADANPVAEHQPVTAAEPSTTAPASEAPLENGTAPDVEMADSVPASAPTEVPAPAPQATPIATSTPAPAPAAVTPTSTTTRNSPHPSMSQAPTQPFPHGSPTRVYLNQHVTPHLLEAMKHLATNEPEKPLKFLSEFLAQKSAELEG